MMFGYGEGGWPIWATTLMWVGMLALLGVLVWAGYALANTAARRPRQERSAGGRLHDGPCGTDARQLLDERLARGQIDAAEYQSLRERIAAGDDHAPAGAGTQ